MIIVIMMICMCTQCMITCMQVCETELLYVSAVLTINSLQRGQLYHC